jgi:eukaryotic-like serine/threonine-protein kinase
VVKEEGKDRLAERQARAAIALVRLGKAEEVWPLLVHSPDPRLRSFIVNLLKPLGADPQVVAAGLSPVDPSARIAGRGSPDPALLATAGFPASAMVRILFHPETSIRRALILALGTYGTDGLAPAERDPLIAKLLDLYRDDPDAGIHGAAEWALRQWNEEGKLKTAQIQLGKLKDRGARRWFVNSQGQTFAVIDGQVEFRMGSPRGEPDRDTDETPHARVIPRHFAIADKEVTVEQYQRFRQDGNPQFGLERSYLDKYSPDPNVAMVGVSWFGPAAYCNWLSKQEGLPQDQWCYLPNKQEEYDVGMTIPADALKRTGYRLPAEPEWEYACRAGTVTSRYYGLSIGLLQAYARYAANSDEHVWPGGTLQPNELGLFDMLGNTHEWCQERFENYQSGTLKSAGNDILDIRNNRLLRGGSVVNRPALVRSALRNWGAPSGRLTIYGFRPSRTYD